MSHGKRGPKGQHEPKLVTAVFRALDVLAALNQAGSPLRLTEISKRTGLSKATAYRLLLTLAQREWVAYLPELERYTLGPTVVEYGMRRLQGLDLRRIALPHMRRLRDRTRETVTLSMLIGNQRQYVEQVESPQEVRQTVELGRRASLHAGGSGKAILAFLPEDRLTDYLAAPLEPVTQQTIRDPELLREELAKVRRLGYAYSIQERQTGAASVGAPVFGKDGAVVGSLSVSGPYQRFTREAIAEYGPLVRESALEISRQIGWTAMGAADQPAGG